MALVLTHSLTEISKSYQEYFLGGGCKGSQCVGPVYQSGTLTLLETSGPAIGQ